MPEAANRAGCWRFLLLVVAIAGFMLAPTTNARASDYNYDAPSQTSLDGAASVAGTTCSLPCLSDVSAAVPALGGTSSDPGFAAEIATTPAARITNGTQFEVLSSQPISGASRSAHRASANKQLFGELESDPALRQFYDDTLGSDVIAHVSSGKGALRNPPGTQWHHPSWDANSMLLLRREVHLHPQLQNVLHLGPGGRGGYADFYGAG